MRSGGGRATVEEKRFGTAESCLCLSTVSCQRQGKHFPVMSSSWQWLSTSTSTLVTGALYCTRSVAVAGVSFDWHPLHPSTATSLSRRCLTLNKQQSRSSSNSSRDNQNFPNYFRGISGFLDLNKLYNICIDQDIARFLYILGSILYMGAPAWGLTSVQYTQLWSYMFYDAAAYILLMLFCGLCHWWVMVQTLAGWHKN